MYPSFLAVRKRVVLLCSCSKRTEEWMAEELSGCFKGCKTVCLRNAVFACLGLVFWQGWESCFMCRYQLFVSLKNVQISLSLLDRIGAS